MLKINNRLLQAQLASTPVCHKESEDVQQERKALQQLATNLRNVCKMTNDSIFCGLRIPDRFQKVKQEISLVVLTGKGIFCIDVKNWVGEVSRDGKHWLVKHKGEVAGEFSRSVQHPDPLLDIKKKIENLWNFLVEKGVGIKKKQMHHKVIFINPKCQLEAELQKHEEDVVGPEDVDSVMLCFQDSYLTSLTDAITPYWITGHLSYQQLKECQSALRGIGTWDVVELQGGMRLLGDYNGCPSVALDRKETELLEFSHQRNATMGYVWAILGYTPQVTVRMFERGGRSWGWQPSTGTAVIPYNAHIVFRVCGEDADAKIPANDIDRIILSI
ncbi:uncharacterized protein LOC116940582 [Petromyzon marinus]|uniref:uncharacterized protein LOC116940582 n=1 Tax=Petromyzon marinus TaxID=7757 RepID=UPI003F6EDD49